MNHFLMVLRSSLLTLSLICCVITNVQAAPDDATPAAPTTATAQQDKNAFNFKVIEDKDELPVKEYNFKYGSEDPSAEFVMPTDKSPLKILVGYPRWDISISANPQTVAFRQKLEGTAFEPNFSAASSGAYSVLARVNFNPDFFFEGEHSTYSISSVAQTGGGITVEEATALIDATLLRGFGCSAISSSSHKVCYGLELGSDSTPSLEFSGASNLKMTKIKDFVVGPSLIYSYPPLPYLRVLAKLGYLHGLAIGQNSVLGVKSDGKLHAQFGFEGDVTDRFRIGLLGDYFLRTVKVEGVRGNFKESWNVVSSNFGTKLSFTYSF